MDQQTAMKHQQMQAGHMKAGSNQPARLVGAHKGGQHAEPLMQQTQATHPILGNKMEQYQQQEQFRQQNLQQQQQPKDQVSVGGTQFGGGMKSNEYQPPLEKQKEMDKHPHIEMPKHMLYAGGIANLHEQLEGRPYHYDTNKLRGINNDHNTDNVNLGTSGGSGSGGGGIGMKGKIKDKPTESFDDNKRQYEQQQDQAKSQRQQRGMENKEGPATAPSSPINEESAPGGNINEGNKIKDSGGHHLPGVIHHHLPAQLKSSSTLTPEAPTTGMAATLAPHKSTDEDVAERVTSSEESSEDEPAVTHPTHGHGKRTGRHTLGGDETGITDVSDITAPIQPTASAHVSSGRKKMKNKSKSSKNKGRAITRKQEQMELAEEKFSHLGLNDARSEQDLMKLMWFSYHPNAFGELKTEVLNDLLADLGVVNCDLAIADLQKHGTSTPERCTMEHFTTWWIDHGQKFTQIKGRTQKQGAWWLLKEFQHYFNRSDKLQVTHPVTVETLSTALAAASYGAPIYSIANSRVLSWYKHMHWFNNQSYSLFELMKALIFDKHSLLLLWPDLPRPTSPENGTIFKS